MSPASFEIKAVGPYVRVLSGFPFPSAGFRDDGAGVPLIRIRDLLPGRTETTFAGAFDPAYLVRPGETLIGMDGDFNCVDWAGVPALLNQRVCKVTADGQELNHRYFRHWLPLKLEEIHRKTPQTTVRHLSTYDIEAISIPFFPRSEQARIAEVLDSLDDIIRQTEIQIRKMASARSGMLAELLLGIEASQRDEIRLGDICASSGGSIQTGPFGSQLHAEDYKSEGTPIITVEHLGEGRIVHRNLPLVGDADRIRLQRYSLRAGDLVFSRVGAIDRCAMVRKAEHGWLFSGRLLRVRAASDEVNPAYLALFLNSERARRWIRNHAVGSTMACLNTKILSGTPVPLPEKRIQDRTVAAVEAIDNQIDHECQELEKARLMKSGLTSDLLTGFIRVPSGASAC